MVPICPDSCCFVFLLEISAASNISTLSPLLSVVAALPLQRNFSYFQNHKKRLLISNRLIRLGPRAIMFFFSLSESFSTVVTPDFPDLFYLP